MSRFAGQGRVFVIEEPIFGDMEPSIKAIEKSANLFVAVPHIPAGMNENSVRELQRALLDEVIEDHNIRNFVSWYYTPMMLAFSDHLRPVATVYDCMDELSAFKFAPPELHRREKELFERADLVFTGGRSLYEAKKEQHPAVYAFPSSIDKEHFARALMINEEMPDQSGIPSPRVGFIGVIDERMDLSLLADIADLKPEWNFVMIGPVVKIDEADLPRRENIHYLGGKAYDQLPEYIAGWDVAMMPFALNESTRFISPTKTPEYLAAGRPVVSTPIRDVFSPYGEEGLVHIAGSPEEFVIAIQNALDEDTAERRRRVDEFLRGMSWDNTFAAMAELINGIVEKRFKKGVSV
jgi:glycosyltransferase involved in cell wall biosynthesis